MRKLKLDLASLQVESFDADGGGDGRGTVRGHGNTETDNSRQCVYTEGQCTWYPVWYCATDKIAFPTRCGGDGCEYDPTNTCYGTGCD
jgi:hypothetical protein